MKNTNIIILVLAILGITIIALGSIYISHRSQLESSVSQESSSITVDESSTSREERVSTFLRRWEEAEGVDNQVELVDSVLSDLQLITVAANDRNDHLNAVLLFSQLKQRLLQESETSDLIDKIRAL